MQIGTILERKWIYGGPRDIWIKNAKFLGELVQKWKLQAYSFEAGRAKNAKALIFDPDIRGGIRLAHLHFKGNVYLVNERQWKEFTGKVIKDFQAKLAAAPSVNFEQLMDLSDAVDSLV